MQIRHIEVSDLAAFRDKARCQLVHEVVAVRSRPRTDVPGLDAWFADLRCIDVGNTNITCKPVDVSEHILFVGTKHV